MGNVDDAVFDELVERLKNAGAAERDQIMVRLLKRYARMIAANARRYGIEETRIDDVIQETLLQVWRSRASFDPLRGHARNWIDRIAKAKSVDQLPTREQPLPEGWDSEDSISSQSEEAEQERLNRMRALECAKERISAAELDEIERRLQMLDYHVAKRPTNAYRSAAMRLKEQWHECYRELFGVPFRWVRGS
jgi:DNA-directed RNA polymerase specialized sigma24 family protein